MTTTPSSSITLPKRDGVGQGTESLIGPSKTTHDRQSEDVIRVFDRFWRKEAARTEGHHRRPGLPPVHRFCPPWDGC
jgi:hypothetical protein